jgi:hypothetical protein
VKVFLRTLEYYEGILFLTTNRLTSFDLAFKSRIHLALKYSALDQSAKKELWKLFINRTSKDAVKNWPEAILDKLSKVDLNGRQIKNTVHTANTLARSAQERLNSKHVESVLETIRDFDGELNDDTQDVLLGSQILRRRSTVMSGMSLTEN